MAVQATITRDSHSSSSSTTTEYCNAALSGTYATGGFTSNLLSIVGNLGTSPLAGTVIRAVTWYSPSGFIYVSTHAYTGRQAVTTTKIFSGPGAELVNGSPVPDALVPVVVEKSKR